MSCKICGSYAINHHCHGRDGSDADLCDVCYWRKRAESATNAPWLTLAHTICSNEGILPGEITHRLEQLEQAIESCHKLAATQAESLKGGNSGKHAYSGAGAAPGPAPGGLVYTWQNTFSVGIFEWVPKSSGKGTKKSAVKVRVKGPVSREACVYRKAKQICAELDAGTYTGPKNVKV